MYDDDKILKHNTTATPPCGTAYVFADSEAAETETVMASIQRLRCAVLELSSALNEALRDERSNAAASLQRATALLQDCGVTVTQPAESESRGGLAPWQVRRVLAHIEANLAARIKNQELAEIARLSLFHFCVAFRNSLGEAPRRYIIRRRVERAQGLMLATQKTLIEIASDCGLADQSHLTRLFRRVVGESPSAWRRARACPP